MHKCGKYDDKNLHFRQLNLNCMLHRNGKSCRLVPLRASGKAGRIRVDRLHGTSSRGLDVCGLPRSVCRSGVLVRLHYLSQQKYENHDHKNCYPSVSFEVRIPQHVTKYSRRRLTEYIGPEYNLPRFTFTRRVSQVF